jgi:hypothetical protein
MSAAAYYKPIQALMAGDTVTVDLLATLMRHALADIADIKDQMLVRGAILLRLEGRTHSSDGELLALQSQIQRLERRVTELERNPAE